MLSNIISGAAVLLALAPSALALGSASVTNSCGFSVYYASIDGTAEGMTEMAPGGSMHQAYGNEGTGVSIKMSMNDTSSGPISQFEFTWASGSIYYDLSNIDAGNSAAGYPFAAGGISITPSTGADSANPTCVPVDCPAGTTVCTAAYNAPDDPRTLVCNENTSLSLVLCPGQGWKRDTHVHRETHSRQIRRPHGRAWVKL